MNEDVYTKLDPATRDKILDSLQIRLNEPRAILADLQLTTAKRAELEACLETLAILADESAATLTKAALTDLGMNPEAFARFPSALERAADLWVRDKDRATQAFRWWQANIEVRRQNFVTAYYIPGRDAPLDLDAADKTHLQKMIADALGAALQAKDIRFFEISKRPSPWPGRENEQVIQIDIKRSSDPERVEIDEDGVVLARSLRFIVPLQVVIDPVRRALYVMSRTNPRKLRQSVAAVVMQAFFKRGGDPDVLPKFYAHPGKLARKPQFGFPKETPVVDAVVVRLDYRNLNEPGVHRTAAAERDDVDLYRLADLSRADATHIVHEASICFDLSYPRRGLTTRTCTLKHPNDLAFPHFSAADRAAVDEFLVLNGLIDPDPFKGQVGPFEALAGLSGDIHSWQLKDAVGEHWMRALAGIGALVNGPEADRAHCASCDHYYPVQTDADSGLRVMACPEHTRGVSDRDTQTSRFLPERLAAWLAEQWGTDARRPSESPAGVWDLGIVSGSGKQASIPLMLATGTLGDRTLTELSQRISSRGAAPPGLVISLSSSFLELKLPHGWKVTSLAGLVEAVAGEMSAPADGPRSVITGKKRRKKNPDRWPELWAAYQRIREPNLGHYQAADKLLDLQQWPWGRARMARQLKEKFPEDFPDRNL